MHLFVQILHNVRGKKRQVYEVRPEQLKKVGIT